MQGLWKDSRKNFLKDKAAKVYGRKYDLPKGKENIHQEEEETLKSTTTVKTVTVKQEIFRVKASKNIELDFNFNSCETCEYSSCHGAVDKFNENGFTIFRACSYYSHFSDLNSENNRTRRFAKYKFERENPYCRKNKTKMAYHTIYKDFFVYYSVKEKNFIDYDTDLKLTDWNIEVKRKSEDISYNFIPRIGVKLTNFPPVYETVEEKTITNFRFYPSLRNRFKNEFLYGKPLEADFFRKYYSYGRRKGYCRKMANRATRSRSKAWLRKVKDKDCCFDGSFPKSHACEKSIAWCVS